MILFLPPANTIAGRWCFQSCLSVHERGLHVAITHAALDLTIQGSPPGPSQDMEPYCTGTSLDMGPHWTGTPSPGPAPHPDI